MCYFLPKMLNQYDRVAYCLCAHKYNVHIFSWLTE